MKKLGSRLWTLLDKTMRFCACRILRIKVSEEKWESFLQFVKFGLVGLSNVVVSYVVYLAVLFFFRAVGWIPNADYLVAQFIGFFLSILWSFYLNRKYVFPSENESVPWVTALLKTYASYAFTGFFLNSLLSMLWVEVLELSEFIVPIINLIINVPVNFVLNKFWAFRQRKSDRQKQSKSDQSEEN